MTKQEELIEQLRLIRLMTDRLCRDTDDAIYKNFKPEWPAHCCTRTAVIDRIRILRAELTRLSKLIEGYNIYDN